MSHDSDFLRRLDEAHRKSLPLHINTDGNYNVGASASRNSYRFELTQTFSEQVQAGGLYDSSEISRRTTLAVVSRPDTVILIGSLDNILTDKPCLEINSGLAAPLPYCQ